MGIGIVLLFWGAIGSGLALGGGRLLRKITDAFTRRYFSADTEDDRIGLNRFALRLPVYCLLWVAAVFVLQAAVNSTLLDRDIGLGDSWDCPLLNGYAIEMVDVPDQGTVFKPKTKGGSSVSNQSDAISGVSALQIDGPYILGAFDSDSFQHFGQDTPTVNGYFLLDTRVGNHIAFATETGLREAATRVNIALHLKPIGDVYQEYRFTWFDYLAGALLLALPVILLSLLVRRVISIRRRQITAMLRSR